MIYIFEVNGRILIADSNLPLVQFIEQKFRAWYKEEFEDNCDLDYSKIFSWHFKHQLASQELWSYRPEAD